MTIDNEHGNILSVGKIMMTHIGGVPYNVVTRVNILCIGGLRGRRSIGMRTGRINSQLKRQQQQQKKKRKLATRYILHKNCIMQSMDNNLLQRVHKLRVAAEEKLQQ